MENRDYIKAKVNKYYWQDDINCATTNLKILSDIFSIELSEQVIDAALGMHGAGKYGAQCGLVEGTLMFLGIIGRGKGIPDDKIVRPDQESSRRILNLIMQDTTPRGISPGQSTASL